MVLAVGDFGLKRYPQARYSVRTLVVLRFQRDLHISSTQLHILTNALCSRHIDINVLVKHEPIQKLSICINGEVCKAHSPARQRVC